MIRNSCVCFLPWVYVMSFSFPSSPRISPRTKRPALPPKHVRNLLLHRPCLHVTIKATIFVRHTRSEHRDHVGGIFNIQCDTNLYLAFEIGPVAETDGERCCFGGLIRNWIGARGSI